MARFDTRYRKHIQEIGIGLFAYEAFNFFYDWIFYPFALVYWGIEKGSIVLVVGSLIQCALLFWLYDHMRIDWVGAHALRELESKENKSRFEHMAVWLGKAKKTWWERLLSPIVFISLTLPIDPLIVALHYRKRHFSGVTARDWGILISAVVAANLWWLVKIGLIIEFLRLWWSFLFYS